MVRQCQVCGKLDTFHPELSFHRFPVDPEKRNVWLSLVGITENRRLPKRPEVCSNHFHPSDIIMKQNGLRYIKSGACPGLIEPSLFPSEESSEYSSDSSVDETPSRLSGKRLQEAALANNSQLGEEQNAPPIPIVPKVETEESQSDLPKVETAVSESELLQVVAIIPEPNECRLSLRKDEYGTNKIQPLAKKSVYCRLCFECIPFPSQCVSFCGAHGMNLNVRIQNMIKLIMPSLDLNKTLNPVICLTCRENVTSAYNFISKCLKNQDLLIPHKQQESFLDIETVVLAKSQQTENQQIESPKKSANQGQKRSMPLNTGALAKKRIDDIINNVQNNVILDQFDQPDYIKIDPSEDIDMDIKVKLEPDEIVIKAEPETLPDESTFSGSEEPMISGDENFQTRASGFDETPSTSQIRPVFPVLNTSVSNVDTPTSSTNEVPSVYGKIVRKIPGVILLQNGAPSRFLQIPKFSAGHTHDT